MYEETKKSEYESLINEADIGVHMESLFMLHDNHNKSRESVLFGLQTTTSDLYVIANIYNKMANILEKKYPEVYKDLMAILKGKCNFERAHMIMCYLYEEGRRSHKFYTVYQKKFEQMTPKELDEYYMRWQGKKTTFQEHLEYEYEQEE